MQIVLCVLALTFLIGPFAAAASEIPREKTFIIGRVSENPKKHHAAMEKMGAYIQSHLMDLGYEAVDVVFAKDLNEMVRYFRDGKVDALSETPFSALSLIDEGRAEPLLREWKKGVSSYHSVFFTAKDGPVTSLADLKGKRIAFEDPGSTSAFLIPLAELRQAGVEVVELAHIDQMPPADKAGYLFTRDEMTQLMWVARGIVDAGAFSNLNWADFSNTRVVSASLKLFHESKPVLRSMFLVRGNLDPTIKSRIADTLMAMPDDEAGRRVLKVYNKVLKYDRLSPEQMSESIANVRKMSAVLPGLLD